MSEAQPGVQRITIERVLDLVEDVSLSSDNVIAAFRQRIAAWQPPRAARTQEDAEGACNTSLRLQGLVAAFSNQMTMLIEGLRKA